MRWVKIYFIRVFFIIDRVPCTNKTDADLPRYGKKTELDTAHSQKVSTTQNVDTGGEPVTAGSEVVAVLTIPEGMEEVFIDTQVDTMT